MPPHAIPTAHLRQGLLLLLLPPPPPTVLLLLALALPPVLLLPPLPASSTSPHSSSTTADMAGWDVDISPLSFEDRTPHVKEHYSCELSQY
jgi:hypothetical protein